MYMLHHDVWLISLYKPYTFVVNQYYRCVYFPWTRMVRNSFLTYIALLGCETARLGWWSCPKPCSRRGYVLAELKSGDLVFVWNKNMGEQWKKNWLFTRWWFQIFWNIMGWFVFRIPSVVWNIFHISKKSPTGPTGYGPRKNLSI